MTWLTTKEVSGLIHKCERAIRDDAVNKKMYTYQKVKGNAGRGGNKIEILLESLPEYAQKAYHNQINGDSQFVFNTDYTSTKAQKEKADLKKLAVKEYKKFLKESKKGGMKKTTDIMDIFVKHWNREHDFHISCKNLYDWMQKLKKGKSLVDGRGGYNRGQSKIPDKYKEEFNSLYLQQSKPSLQSCYDEIRIKATVNGDSLPGIRAFRNHVNNLDTALVKRLREGKKAFDDTCLPYIERNYSLLSPNDYWVSDHHLWDVFVRIPDGKGGWKLERPWGSYWMDMRTRKMMSSIIRVESPNSDVVLCSFGLGVKQFGIPKGVRLDNGKDYKARDMFYPEGHYLKDEDTDRIYRSLASNMQIDVTYAIPYNAKAKPIERVFNTFEEQLGKKYPSYAGSNAKKRPEDMKELDIMDVITLEDFIRQHDSYVYEFYNNRAHSGDSMDGKSPNRLYADIEFSVRKASNEVLYFSLMRVKGTRVVQRNGITFNGVHFYNDNCINYIKQKVVAKYDPTKPEILYIFDTNENFLFIATEIKKRGWSLTEEEYQEENHRKKIARLNAMKGYKANNDVRSTEEIGERIQRLADSTEKTDAAMPKTIELVRNEQIEGNFRRVSLSDIERNYEDVLLREKERQKAVDEVQKAYADKFKKKFLDRANATRKERTEYDENEGGAHANFG